MSWNSRPDFAKLAILHAHSLSPQKNLWRKKGSDFIIELGSARRKHGKHGAATAKCSGRVLLVPFSAAGIRGSGALLLRLVSGGVWTTRENGDAKEFTLCTIS